MGTSNLLQKIPIYILLMLLCQAATAQVRIYGTVYDRTARFGMPAVSVMSTSGAGTITDSLGHYSIKIPFTDSISFSYQGKATQKFPVSEIKSNRPFDMSLHVDIHVLPTVDVTAYLPRSYQLDSIDNRNEYRKVFDFAPNFLSGSSNGMGVGVDLNMLFSIRKIKRMEAFRKFLEQDERDKYVDHRFNKALVKKLTGLQSPALDVFMKEYRPTYEMIQAFNTEYDYYQYIKEWATYFAERWQKDHPGQP
jgi:hypothetical protein